MKKQLLIVLLLLTGCEKPDFPHPTIINCNCGVIINRLYPPKNNFSLVVRNDCDNAVIDTAVVDSAWFMVNPLGGRVCNYK